MASASTPSTNDQAKDLILVHTVQMKQIMIKAQISGIMIYSGLRVLEHRKYRRPRSRPHLIDPILGARITLILLFASLFY